MKNSQKPVIQVSQLVKSFGTHTVLKGFDLELFEGENLVVMGKSGSGKSVLIKCIIGLETPDSGSIAIYGKQTENFDEAEWNEMPNAGVSISRDLSHWGQESALSRHEVQVTPCIRQEYQKTRSAKFHSCHWHKLPEYYDF